MTTAEEVADLAFLLKPLSNGCSQEAVLKILLLLGLINHGFINDKWSGVAN